MSACFSTGFVVYSGYGCISWILSGNQIVRIQFDHERELSGCPDQAGIYYLYIAYNILFFFHLRLQYTCHRF